MSTTAESGVLSDELMAALRSSTQLGLDRALTYFAEDNDHSEVMQLISKCRVTVGGEVVEVTCEVALVEALLRVRVIFHPLTTTWDEHTRLHVQKLAADSLKPKPCDPRPALQGLRFTLAVPALRPS